MKPVHKILAASIIAILVLDAAGSFASKLFSFNYAYLLPVSLLIYSVAGFKATLSQNLKTGTLFAAITGLTDSTFGWGLSTIIGANVGDTKQVTTPVTWLLTALFVTLLATIIGLIGGALANLRKKTSA